MTSDQLEMQSATCKKLVACHLSISMLDRMALFGLDEALNQPQTMPGNAWQIILAGHSGHIVNRF